MTYKKMPCIALLGNPNSGKSSLFNYLTGLRQNVSNFPGVTVDKKSGIFELKDGSEALLIDFPGTYSLYPNSTEEKIVIKTLTNPADDNYPDLVIYVADATQLERHLLFATQIVDLGFDMIFVLNMIDLIEGKEADIHLEKLEQYLGVQVISTSVRKNVHLDVLKNAIGERLIQSEQKEIKPIYKASDVETFVATRVKKITNCHNLYLAKIIGHHYKWLNHIPSEQKLQIADIISHSGFNDLKIQVQETMQRYDQFGQVVRNTIVLPAKESKTATDKIDDIITHRLYGPIIFFGIMFLVFQSIYSWATIPMDLIEQLFARAGAFAGNNMPDVWWSDLLINGLLAGLGGVMVFVPQIAILFFLVALLEESGYMSRAVYMFDSIMQRFGMNGRSMVALISSGACAIPAIMSTRTISNPKERLITILVSPLISCSARLPVYAVLVGFVVPANQVFGIFNAQGLVFMGLYLLGIVGALMAALVFKTILASETGSFLMIELPNYKPPIWKNVLLTVKEKVLTFIWEAGKVIVLISMVLWFLASYGPPEAMTNATLKAESESVSKKLNVDQKSNLIASYNIEASFIGHIGKWMEPAISPLGFDWKIGIAILTSFAAREVFVGTMATIYSIGSDQDERTLRQKMAEELRPGTDIKVYNTPTALSLLIFYVFAMQCMSTLAIVKRETNTWKWPIVQFLFMSVMAYVGAFVAFQVLS
ncbi:MAG: ferrous iron transport protein B [Saprospiraceae bacterium]|nr:ferrous iron transport protein B [Saprospiraceae bacterium]